VRKQLFGLAASCNFGIEVSGVLFWFCSDPIVLSDFFFFFYLVPITEKSVG
jgi:hypothetical protein